MMSKINYNKKISLYLHFPFCERKCRYCDFLSGPASEEAREEYVGLLCREIRLRKTEVEENLFKGVFIGETECGDLNAEADDSLDCSNNETKYNETKYCVDTVFLGGGTPSLMTPSQLSRIMEALRNTYNVDPDAEISMEINPGTADFTKLRAYRKAGVNRLSIGVQSFDDAELRMLGRIHTAEEAREIFHAARKAGFSNINLDLMSALPGQTLESWSKTLREAIELGPEHISAYSLIIEEGTPLADMLENGRLPLLPSEEEDREIYHFTGKFLVKSGYRRYEISNYARDGYVCRHNCGYWTGHEYFGLGLGASSDLGGERFRNPSDMEEYRRATDEAEAAFAARTGAEDAMRRERQCMTPEDRMEEFMFLGLRMTDGVSEKEFERRFGKSMEEVFGDVIKRHLQQGVIRRFAVETDNPAGDYRIALTEYGLDVANHVMAEYLL